MSATGLTHGHRSRTISSTTSGTVNGDGAFRLHRLQPDDSIMLAFLCSPLLSSPARSCPLLPSAPTRRSFALTPRAPRRYMRWSHTTGSNSPLPSPIRATDNDTQCQIPAPGALVASSMRRGECGQQGALQLLAFRQWARDRWNEHRAAITVDWLQQAADARGHGRVRRKREEEAASGSFKTSSSASSISTSSCAGPFSSSSSSPGLSTGDPSPTWAAILRTKSGVAQPRP